MRQLSLKMANGIMAVVLALIVCSSFPASRVFAQEHYLEITSLWFDPNTVVVGGAVDCNVIAFCTLGHELTYLWGAGEGSFDDPTGASPVWTAPGSPGSVGIWVSILCTGGVSNGSISGVNVVSADTVTINAGPSGNFNPTISGGGIFLSVSASDNMGHDLTYLWSATGGTFDNPTVQNAFWQAPVNTSCTTTDSYSITVTVTCSEGSSKSGSYDQGVLPEADTVRMTSGPSATPNPVVSAGYVNLSVTAEDDCGHALSYLWSATGGTFDDETAQNPVWTAPVNGTGITLNYDIFVTVTCSHDATREAQVHQEVLSVLRNLYVDSANRCPGTGSLADPYCKIQLAVDVSVTGDTVIVRDGVYTGAGNQDIDFDGKAITLRSENGPENCIINAVGDGRGVLFQNGEVADSVLDGFTITNEYKDYGGGIYCWASSPTITNCIIKGSSAYAGGGMLLVNSSAVVSNCTITGNEATFGGGIYSSFSLPSITNCTIGDNTAYAGGGVTCLGSSAVITNSILWGDVATLGPELWVGSVAYPSSLAVSYSDVEGGMASAVVETGCTLNWDIGANLDSDPLFLQPGYSSGGQRIEGDYHLLKTSPVIDVGDTGSAPAKDVDGENRPNGTACDLGSDEYRRTNGATLLLVPDAPQVRQGGILGLDATAFNENLAPITFDYWTNATLPDGTPYPLSGALFGPYSVTLGALESRSAPMTHRIPATAPLGTYTYNAFIGAYPTSAHEYHFNFEVSP